MGVVIEVRKVPQSGSIVFRLFNLPRCVLIHWTDAGSIICPGKSKCKRHEGAQLKGYSCAYEWIERSTAWCPVVMEWTENMIQQIGLTFTEGDVWELRRMGAGKTPKQVIGQELGQIPIAPGTQPWDVRLIVERYLRQYEGKWDVSPDSMIRVEGEEDLAGRPPGLPAPIRADVEVASPEVVMNFREKLKEARQGATKKVN